MDVKGIENGENFKTVIVKAIEESTVFLYFSSKNSNGSPWTAKEVGIAVARKKPIIPIWLDNSPFNKDVEFDLVNLDVVDCTDDDKQQLAMGKLIHSIQKRCQCALSEETVIAEHYEQKKQRKRKRLLFSFMVLLLLGGGGLYTFSYITDKSEEKAKSVYAEGLIERADSLFEIESERCFYDGGVKCFDSVSSSQLVYIKCLYDSVSVLFPLNESVSLSMKIREVQDMIDSAYMYYEERYNICVQSKREYTAQVCKRELLELKSSVSLEALKGEDWCK